jgi:uracil phosphoribosyltransferase
MLVVEGMLVSGAQMARAAARAKAAGAERVVGAAVLAEPTGLASCRREIGDEITALRELRLA